MQNSLCTESGLMWSWAFSLMWSLKGIHRGRKTAEFGQTVLAQTLAPFQTWGPFIWPSSHSCASPHGFPRAILLKPGSSTSSRTTSYRLQNKSPHSSDRGFSALGFQLNLELPLKVQPQCAWWKMTLFPLSHHLRLPARGSYTPAPGSKTRNRNLLHAPVANCKSQAVSRLSSPIQKVKCTLQREIWGPGSVCAWIQEEMQGQGEDRQTHLWAEHF